MSEVQTEVTTLLPMKVGDIVDQIRDAYPNPQKSREDSKVAGNYCVGGAALLFLGGVPEWMENRNRGTFPSGMTIYDGLEGKFDLSRKDYYVFGKVTRLNDEGNFEGSWDALRDILV